jgi:leucyl/phenylalanyl-tRNA--protein transferase
MVYRWAGLFFGESMFHHQVDASKVALYYLVEQMKKWEFHFIDAQLPTAHLKRMGAEEIPRKEFLERLARSLKYSTRRCSWEREV